MKPSASGGSIELTPVALKRSAPISSASGMMPSHRSRLLSKPISPQTPNLAMQQTKENRVVRRTIVVNADVQRAFQVFTENMGQWWPKEHHIGGTPPVAVVVEQCAGGRCYQKGEDDAECDWDTVVDWEPPTRV